MRPLGNRGRLGLACLTAVVASLGAVVPASAAPSGVVTVTGTSVSKIELSLPDSTAAFGTNLTPDGVASNSTDTVTAYVDGASPSTGACYKWPGSSVVRSNVTYKVSVTASAGLAKLGFLTANPGTYAQCVAGEPASTNMFPAATPAGSQLGVDPAVGFDLRDSSEVTVGTVRASVQATSWPGSTVEAIGEIPPGIPDGTWSVDAHAQIGNGDQANLTKSFTTGDPSSAPPPCVTPGPSPAASPDASPLATR